MTALPFVDTHLHFWDLERFRYPWLADFPELASDYLPGDLLADAAGRLPAALVHVQAEVDHALDPVLETEWVAGLADALGPALPPLAHVAYADLRDAGLDRLLERHRAHEVVRGIRQEVWFDPASTRADVPRENMLADPAWAAGLARLPAHGLSFDLLAWPHQLAQAADLCAAVPDLQVVVDHTGLPPAQEGADLQVWREGLRRFAEIVPRSVLKLSAMAFVAAPWTVETVAPRVREAIEIFGADRCMFGSNFPVDRSGASYDGLWSAYEQIVAEASPAERSALFSETARRTYRIDLHTSQLDR